MTPDDIKAATLASLKARPVFRDTVLAIIEIAPERHRDAIAEMLWSAFVNAALDEQNALLEAMLTEGRP